MLQALCARLGTPDVYFLGHVSNEELTALYDIADLFLCASEHEGFCVPIIEAFYKRVPVLAYAATAVPATMDGGGVLYDTTDPFEIARLMDAVVDDERIGEAVVASQDAALARLQARDFAGTLLGSLAEVMKRPPRPAPPVAWDFWAQYRPVPAVRGTASVPTGAVSGAAGRSGARGSGLGTRGSGLGARDSSLSAGHSTCDILLSRSWRPSARHADRRIPMPEPRAPNPEPRE